MSILLLFILPGMASFTVVPHLFLARQNLSILQRSASLKVWLEEAPPPKLCLWCTTPSNQTVTLSLYVEILELSLQSSDQSYLHCENLFWQWNESFCFYHGPQLAWRHVAKVSRLRDIPQSFILWPTVSKILSHPITTISWHSLHCVILQVGGTCDLHSIKRI